jgi:uncharacterized protein
MWDPAFLADTGHRPFPVQAGPWIMPQRWEHLLFYHWPVDSALVASKLPTGMELDLWHDDDGPDRSDPKAWLAIVPFLLHYMPRGLHYLPIWVGFNELNLRTYVRYKGTPGVYFFTLEADELLSIAVARTAFHLTYQYSQFQVTTTDDKVAFSAQRNRVWNQATGQHNQPHLNVEYGPMPGSSVIDNPSPLERFLTERYCFFSADAKGRIHQGNIHHSPWPLQPAWCTETVNTVPQAFGFEGPTCPPLLHYCRSLDVAAWPVLRC